MCFFVQRCIWISLDLELARRYERGLNACLVHGFAVVLVRLPHANRAHFATGGDIELASLRADPVSRRSCQTVSDGHHRFLGTSTQNSITQFRDAIHAAARAVDVQQDLTNRIIGNGLPEHLGNDLGADHARAGDVIHHISTLCDDAVNRDDGNATTRNGSRGLSASVSQHTVCLDLKLGDVAGGRAL